jgi:cytochrome c oxidase subunit IV
MYGEVLIAVRLFAALVFAAAAVGKLRNWHVFEGVVANYRMLPEPLVRPFAYLLPPLELLVAVALVTLSAPVPETAAATLLGLFAAAMGVNIVRGRREIDCGCFSSALKQTLRWSLVVRNVVMIVLLTACAAADGGQVTGRMWISGVLGGAALFIVFQCLNTLWAVPGLRPGRPS